MIFNESEQIKYFFVGCIPVRIIIALLPIFINKSYLFYYGIVLFCISLSFAYLYFNNLRLNAPEGGGITWWAEYRIIHVILYLIAALFAFQGMKIATVPLLLDMVFGSWLFAYKHFM
tara:strand:+ start:236 stop:586 length:351 start_codon:yes stop_codon:yes gene_type:complete